MTGFYKIICERKRGEGFKQEKLHSDVKMKCYSQVSDRNATQCEM